MRYLVSLMLSTIIGASLATSACGSDDLGIYFDEAGTTAVTTASGTATVHGYLILTNPSASTQLDFWKVSITPNIDAPSHLERVSGTPRYGTNLYNPLPGSSFWAFLVSNEGLPPLPFELSMILADVYVYLGGESGPIGLYFVSQAYYSTDGILDPFDPNRIIMYPSSGSSDRPVAVINGSAPVAMGLGSLDAVKALYR